MRGDRRHRSAKVLLWAGLLGACASGRSVGEDADPTEVEDFEEQYDLNSGLDRTQAAPSVTYARTAEANYQRGEAAFEDEDFASAQRFYYYLRSKFPYSKYAALADLRIGDCHFERSRYLEAIDAYQNFARLHPSHDKVPYSMYRIGVAYYEQIPADFFPLPPAHEKDQNAVADAAMALKRFVERYPDAPQADEARKLLRKVREELLAHELYAAKFYRRLGKTAGYAGRLEVIRTKFPEVGVTDKLLYDLVVAYVRLERWAQAEDVLVDFQNRFPSSPKFERAEKLFRKEKPKKAS